MNIFSQFLIRCNIVVMINFRKFKCKIITKGSCTTLSNFVLCRPRWSFTNRQLIIFVSNIVAVSQWCFSTLSAAFSLSPFDVGLHQHNDGQCTTMFQLFACLRLDSINVYARASTCVYIAVVVCTASTLSLFFSSFDVTAWHLMHKHNKRCSSLCFETSKSSMKSLKSSRFVWCLICMLFFPFDSVSVRFDVALYRSLASLVSNGFEVILV